MPKRTLIDLQEISKVYGFGDATTIALDEVGLKINEGEFVAVMGPSGSGKSTLMHIIGLLDQPTYGTYKLGARNVAKLRSNQRARARRDRIGFVFQSFNLLPRINVLDNVALPLTYKGMTQVKRQEQAAHVLERVGMHNRQYYLPRQLSGGQIQRASIARALVNDPEIIIADEPTGNLDSLSSRVVMELLGEIHASGKTILMVTHNPELTRWASRVIYMQDGEIVHEEKTKIGEVAATARRKILFVPKKYDDDDLAGVSAMIKTIPGGEAASAPKRKRKSTRRRRTK